MTTLNPSTIKKTVTGWNILFPGTREDAQLAFICTKIMEHCSGVYTDEQFRIAATMVERDSKYFPVPADLIAVRDQVYQKHQSRVAQTKNLLPEETELSLEEVERNKRKIEIIRRQLAGKMTMTDAIAEQKKLVGYAK